MDYEELYKRAKKTRSDWGSGDAKRDAGLKDPENIRCICDIPYAPSDRPEDKEWHLTDIYYPADLDCEYYPVIVSIHGGGWFYGDKKLYSHYCKHLASLGFAVVNFNYRLAPENPYPIGFFDVCSLFSFIEENADEYSLDMNRLFAVGDSCGAQFLSQYCVYATSSEYRSLFSFSFEGLPVPKRVALNCGVYDLRISANRDEFTSFYIWNGFTGRLKESLMNIMDYVNPSFPESFIMYSENDPLKVCTPVLSEALNKAGVKHIVKGYGKDSPADGHVFHVNMRSELGKLCNKEETDFFMAY